MPNLVGLMGMIPGGFQAMTLSNSTALSINSTARADASCFIFSVETNDVRMRADGTAPTKTTGVLFGSASGGPYIIDWNGTSAVKFQRTTGTAKVSIQGWRWPGTVIGGR